MRGREWDQKNAELLQARASGHQGIWEDVKTNSESEDGRGLAKEAKRLGDRRKEEEDL